MAILNVSDLVVSFDGFRAVDGLDLSVDEGELRCLIGANGAGKSTTLDLICGKTPVTAGRIVYDGSDVTRMHEHRRARLGIGRKFQVPTVFSERTVRENLEVADAKHPSVWHTVRSFRRGYGNERLERVAEQVGLEDRLDTKASHLSHGETQWLEIAILLMQDSRLILMDEPTAGMTMGETTRTAEIFNTLRGRHTLVVVEHDMAFVREIADVISVLHQGRMLAQGTVAEIETDERVREAYLGKGGISHA